MSASMMDALLPLLEGGNVQQVSRQLGIGEAQASTAIKAAVPLLMGALQRQTASSGGLDSLAGARDRDHDGSILDDIGGFLGGGVAGAAGAGILGRPPAGQPTEQRGGLAGQVHGPRRRQHSQAPGHMLAPLVMGALGRAKRQGPTGSGGLADLLGGATRQVDQQAPDLMSSLRRMLDADGDGSAMDDIASIAGSLFSSKR